MCDHAVVTSQIGYNGSLLQGTFGTSDIEIKACMDMNQVVFELWNALDYLNNNPSGLPVSPTNGYVLHGNTDGSIYWDAPSGGGSQNLQQVSDIGSTANVTSAYNYYAGTALGSSGLKPSSILGNIPNGGDLTFHGYSDPVLGILGKIYGVSSQVTFNGTYYSGDVQLIATDYILGDNTAYVGAAFNENGGYSNAFLRVDDIGADFVEISVDSVDGARVTDRTFGIGLSNDDDYGEEAVVINGDRAIIDKGHIDRLIGGKLVYYQFTGSTDYTLNIGNSYVLDFDSNTSNSVYIPNPTTCMDGYTIRVKAINVGAGNDFVVSGSGNLWWDGVVGDTHAISDGDYEFMFDETTNRWYKIN